MQDLVREARRLAAPRSSIGVVQSSADGSVQVLVPGNPHPIAIRSITGETHEPGANVIVTLEPNPNMAACFTASPYRCG